MFNNEIEVVNWLLENPEISYELKTILRVNAYIKVPKLYMHVMQRTISGSMFSAKVYVILGFYSDDIINLYNLGKLNDVTVSEIIIECQDSVIMSAMPHSVNILVMKHFLETNTAYSEDFLNMLLYFCKEYNCQCEIVYRSAAKILHAQLSGEYSYNKNFNVHEFESFIYDIGAGYWEKNIVLGLLFSRGYYKLYFYYRFFAT